MASDTIGASEDINSRFSGHFYLRGEAGYEDARVGRIWHANKPDRYPAAVLMAESEDDLVNGVRLAREKGWSIAVRSGGHSFPVWSVRDSGLLIDLGGFKELSYDPETQIVSATTSVKGGDELNPYLKQFGRYFAAGGCPSVGLGGFLLQGGMGWNFRGWGYSCEQVFAVDLVTADGELIRADDTQNTDLFWAARGVGPGFCGLIVRFHLKTRPITDGVAVSMQAYPVERYADVLQWLWDQHPHISDKVYFNAVSARPPIPVPGHDGGLVFMIWACAFCDTQEEAAAALEPLKTCPYRDEAILVSDAQPTTLPEQLSLVDQLHPQGLYYKVDSAWVDGPQPDIIQAMKTLVIDRQAEDIGYTFLIFRLPRPDDAPEIAMDLGTDLCVGAYIIHEADSASDKLRNWLRDAMGELEPYTVGQNWGDSDQTFREVKCLTDASWARFQKIRAARDPDGVFHSHLAGEGGFQNRNGWEAKD
ncbi:MAG: FAD-binding oxidoreductase [Hyphomonadaceae bacterium]|nr:FAD-binding oxidoreductase [Hyphomonadaceae bacterium]